MGPRGPLRSTRRVEGLTPLILTGSTGVVRYDGRMDELETDGCDLDFRENPTADTDIDGIVLFAGIDPEDAEAVEDKAEAWRRLAELGVNDAS